MFRKTKSPRLRTKMLRRLLPLLFIFIMKRKITGRKLFNLGRNFFYGFVLKREYFPTYPSIVMLEPTNLCNLRCKGCAYQVRGGRPAAVGRNSISLADFRRIIDEIKDTCCALFLYMGGEPFLNQDIFHLIAYAHRAKIFTVIATNGSFVHLKNFGRKVTRAGLDLLIFSISGTKQDIYQRFHRGGNLEMVRKNIQDAVQNKKGLAPRVMVRYLATPENAADWFQVPSFTRELGADAYEMRSLDGKILLVDQLKDKPQKAGGKVAPSRKHCFWLWLALVIRANGEVLPCCYDYYGVPVLGNAHKSGGIKAIWRGSAYQHLRHCLHSGKIPVCCSQCVSGFGFQDNASAGKKQILVQKSEI